MAKGVNIPLTISGLRESREELAQLTKQMKDAEKAGKSLSDESVNRFFELEDSIEKTAASLTKMQKAGDLVGVKFDDLNEVIAGTSHEVLPLSSQIGEMEDRMYQLAAAGDTTSAEFKALQSETARLRGVIIETDREIDLMAGNTSLSTLTDGFNQLAGSVLTLNFKQAGKDLKALGGAFKSFGAVLKANPLFLIVSVVAAVIVAVISLKDNVKFLGVAFDFFADIIGKAIQDLKNFLDFIGASNFKTKELLANYEKFIEKQKEQTSIRVKGLERSIALAQAEGKTTVEMEKDKQKAIIEASKAQIDRLKVVIKWKMLLGELDEEETKRIKDLVKAEIETRQEAEHQIRLIDANAKRESVANTEAEAKEKAEAYKQYVQFREDAARMIQDLELELMADSRQKLLLQNQITYERLREDTLANENLTREEKLKINDYYDKLEAQSKLDILVNNLDSELTIRNEHEEKIKELSVLRTQFDKAQVEERKKLSKEEIEARENLTVNSLQLIAGIADLFAEKNERAAKIAFNVQKAASIAQATIDGYKAVLSTYANTPGGPVLKGIAAGIAGSFAALQIANIAKAKFEGGGGGSVSGSVPSGSLGGGGATSASSSTPSFELFGQANEGNNASSPESQDVTPTMTVKAVVVESDITSTQNKVSKMQKNAEL